MFTTDTPPSLTLADFEKGTLREAALRLWGEVLSMCCIVVSNWYNNFIDYPSRTISKTQVHCSDYVEVDEAYTPGFLLPFPLPLPVERFERRCTQKCS